MRRHALPPLSFSVLGVAVTIDVDSDEVRRMLSTNFGMFESLAPGRPHDLRYTIAFTGAPGHAWRVSRDDARIIAGDATSLLFEVERDLVIQLQHRRAHLLFLHAAAVTEGGRALLLAGDSGAGKSTATWALVQNGFGYLSDELAPVDPVAACVYAYPHAIALKSRPASRSMPRNALDLGRTLHVPVPAAVDPSALAAVPLAAIFFVDHRPLAAGERALASLTPAEASARLYVVTLNALAHATRGLDAVIAIAQRVPCYSLATSNLEHLATLVRSAIGGTEVSSPVTGGESR